MKTYQRGGVLIFFLLGHQQGRRGAVAERVANAGNNPAAGDWEG